MRFIGSIQVLIRLRKLLVSELSISSKTVSRKTLATYTHEETFLLGPGAQCRLGARLRPLEAIAARPVAKNHRCRRSNVEMSVCGTMDTQLALAHIVLQSEY